MQERPTGLVVFRVIQVSVLGIGGLIVCSAGLSTSAIMGLFSEPNFIKRVIGKPKGCLMG